jgi:hypothetical protein
MSHFHKSSTIKNNQKNKEALSMNLKKALSLFVALIMVFALMAPVFAATPTDVVGTTYEGSVGKLVALGIIQGYEDGTFKPDQNITRAEFAKIACYVVGQQAAADLAKGNTKFTDVKSDNWASGYINVASQNGMIKGYPDKTFKPNANVSYAEAITILVRALGMGPVVEGKGTWPANYLSKASSVGITNQIGSLSGNAKAIRGVIAQLAWNTLKTEEWGESKYTSTGVEYGPLGKTLLKDKYGDFVKANGDPKLFEDATVTATQLVGGLGTDQIKISYTGIATALGVTSENTSDNTYKPVGSNDAVITKVVGLNTVGLIGKKVDVFFGKDNKVVSFQVKSSVAQSGNIDKIDTANSKVTIAGKEYTMATSNTIYVNTATKTLAQAKTLLDTPAKMIATAVLNDDGQITTLDAFIADTNAGLSTKEFVVKAIKANSDVTDLYDGSKIFSLDDITGVTSSEKTIFVKNGNLASKSDIKAGNVITWIQVSGSLNYVVISDTKVTGTISSLGVDTGTNRYIPTINGTAYRMINAGNSLMTKTGSDENVSAVDASYKDFNGKSVTLSLDANGQIVYTSGTVTASANYQYGVLSNDITNYGTRQMEVRTSAGTKVTYTVSGDHYKVIAAGAVKTTADADWADADENQRDDTMVKGTFVQYRVNADGTVSAENIVKLGSTAVTVANSLDTNTKSVAGADGAVTVYNDAKSIKIGGNYYYYTPSTIIYSMNTAAGMDKITDVLDGWDAISNSSDNFAATADTDVVTAGHHTAYIVYDSNSNAIKTLVVDMKKQLGTTGKYAVIASNPVEYLVGSDKMIKLSTESGLVEYKVSTDVYSTTDEYTTKVGDLYAFGLTSDGKFNAAADYNGAASTAQANLLINTARVLANKDGEFDHWVVKAVDVGSKRIQFNKNDNTGFTTAERFVTLSTDAKVYDISSGSLVIKSIADVKAGSIVKEFETNSGTQLSKIIIIVKG